MTWNTTNVLAVFLDCDIWVHHWYFFGNIHSFPVISPMGTSQSHELEHCECTVHVPAGVISGKLSGKFKMYLQCSRWVHCWYTVHFLVMYLQCSWWEHHYLPPVCSGGRRASTTIASRRIGAIDSDSRSTSASPGDSRLRFGVRIGIATSWNS